MQFDLLKTDIICHGTRALRVGERAIRSLWKYLNAINKSENKDEIKEIFSRIFLQGIISYPEDLENIDTSSGVIFQIIFENDKLEKIDLVSEKCKGVPSISVIIGNENSERDYAYITVEENQVTDTLLSILSIYAFSKEQNAGFEKLKPIFEHKGNIEKELQNILKGENE